MVMDSGFCQSDENWDYLRFSQTLKFNLLENAMIQKDLLKQVKNAIQEIEAEAEILLYGSRARGDSIDQSDWDFLILLDGMVDDNRTDRIRHRLYEVEWETGEVISSIIRNKKEWNSRPYRSMPIHKVIEREGIAL
jgi:predicted nucleotidyltransferase